MRTDENILLTTAVVLFTETVVKKTKKRTVY